MMSDYFSLLKILIYCCHSLFIILLKRQVLVDQRLSRGYSRLPEGELGAKGCVPPGRREIRPLGCMTQEKGLHSRACRSLGQ